MVTSCCVLNCRSTDGSSRNGEKIHFYRFPKNNTAVRNAWALFVNRFNWTPKEYARICSLHFKPGDFIITPKNRMKIKKGVIPSIYEVHPTVQNHSYKKNVNEFGVFADNSNSNWKIIDEIPSLLPRHEANSSVVTLEESCLASSAACTSQMIKSDNEKSLEEKLKKTEIKYNKERKLVVKLRKKLRMCQQSLRRTHCKLIKKDNVKTEITPDAKMVIQARESLLEKLGFTKYIVMRLLEQKSNKEYSKKEYSKELRTFCLELTAISDKAYNYVRSKLNLCLPDIKTVKRWNRTKDVLNDKTNSKTPLNSQKENEINVEKNTP